MNEKRLIWINQVGTYRSHIGTALKLHMPQCYLPGAYHWTFQYWTFQSGALNKNLNFDGHVTYDADLVMSLEDFE